MENVMWEGISKRFEAFLEDHLEFIDDGDGENGPHLSASLEAPDWCFKALIEAEGEESIVRERHWENYCLEI